LIVYSEQKQSEINFILVTPFIPCQSNMTLKLVMVISIESFCTAEHNGRQAT